MREENLIDFYPPGEISRDCRMSRRGLEYTGTKSTSADGMKCAKWFSTPGIM